MHGLSWFLLYGASPPCDSGAIRAGVGVDFGSELLYCENQQGNNNTSTATTTTINIIKTSTSTTTCKQVTRGTLQTVLKHTAFDEARRLGLRADAEDLLRKEFPKETGVLAVEEVVPGGPADGALEPGDVVVRMNGEMITTFLPWETFLDSGVGNEVEVQVQRGGKEVTVRLKVG